MCEKIWEQFRGFRPYILIINSAITVLKNIARLNSITNNEIYTCTEHVHLLDDHPAECAIEGSELIKKSITEEQRRMIENRDYERAKE